MYLCVHVVTAYRGSYRGQHPHLHVHIQRIAESVKALSESTVKAIVKLICA